MRKFFRNMARTKMKKMGYSNVNLKMRGHWREIVGAYPVNIITGAPMNKGFRGKKKYKAGHIGHIFAY